MSASTIDWVAVVEVMCGGESFGDDYPVPGEPYARPLPEWSFAFPEAEFDGSWDDALEAVDAMVRASLAAAPPEWEFAIGLSGGRDSRHLALAAQAVGRPVARAVCAEHWVRSATSADSIAARLLAEHLGIRLETAPQSRDRYAAEWNKNLPINLATMQHSWVPALARVMGHDLPLLDGLNGGALLGRDPLTRRYVALHETTVRPSDAQMIDFVRSFLFLRAQKRIKAWLRSPRITASTWRDAEERLVERFRRYLEYPNPFQAWIYLERAIHSMALAPYVLMDNDRVKCPYYEDPMASFGLSLPWEFTVRGDLQDHMLRRLYPESAGIPFNTEIENAPVVRLDVDPEAERRSLSVICSYLEGHVREQWLERRREPEPDGRGDRRMVLLAQALAWEESGRPDQIKEAAGGPVGLEGLEPPTSSL